jgi:nicotinamidase-related amidase
MPSDAEPVIAKSTNSAFIRTALDDMLSDLGVTTLVVCGVLTHNSVEATVRHAGNLAIACSLQAMRAGPVPSPT